MKLTLSTEMRDFAGQSAPVYDRLARIGQQMQEAAYGFGGLLSAEDVLLLHRFASHLHVSALLNDAGFTSAGEKADDQSALADYPLPVECTQE